MIDLCKKQDGDLNESFSNKKLEKEDEDINGLPQIDALY